MTLVRCTIIEFTAARAALTPRCTAHPTLIENPSQHGSKLHLADNTTTCQRHPTRYPVVPPNTPRKSPQHGSKLHLIEKTTTSSTTPATLPAPPFTEPANTQVFLQPTTLLIHLLTMHSSYHLPIC